MDGEERLEVGRVGDALTFGDVRPYVDRLKRVSICLDDGSYYNYPTIKRVPGDYDAMPVIGIGWVWATEFEYEGDPLGGAGKVGEVNDKTFLSDALEFLLDAKNGGGTPAARIAGAERRLQAVWRELDSMAGDFGGETGKWLRYAAEDVGQALDNVDGARGFFEEGVE